MTVSCCRDLYLSFEASNQAMLQLLSFTQVVVKVDIAIISREVW
jgi:hypothetical protein